MIRVDLRRLENEAAALEQKGGEAGKIVLYGSSFFGVWGFDRNREQMGGATVCRGFGGSTGEEQLYYYSRLVRPLAPRALILRGGVNDVGMGYTAREAFDLSERVLAYTRADFPEARLFIMPSFDFPSAPARPSFAAIGEYNELVRAFANEGGAELFDINDFVYERAEDIGTYKGFAPVFKEDGLHLHDEGYVRFTAYFRKKLASLGLM